MLLSIRLIPNVDYTLIFQKSHQEPNIVIFSKNGVDILFMALYRPTENRIILNDYYKKAWGSEIYLGVPAADSEPVVKMMLKFNGRHIEAWTAAQATAFDRFDATRHKLAHFARLQGVEDQNNALAFSTESLESTLSLIDSHLMDRRIGRLEQKIDELERVAAGKKTGIEK